MIKVCRSSRQLQADTPLDRPLAIYMPCSRSIYLPMRDSRNMSEPYVLVEYIHELVAVVPISGIKQDCIIEFFSLQDPTVKVERLRLTEVM